MKATKAPSVNVAVTCESDETYRTIAECLEKLTFPIRLSHIKEHTTGTEHTGKTVVELASKGEKRLFYREQILYLERTERTVQIHMADGSTFPVYQSLSEMLAILGKDFLKCNGSYVVNMCMINQKAKGWLLLKDGTKLQLSRTYRQKIESWFAEK